MANASTFRGNVEFGYHRSSNLTYLIVLVPVLVAPLAIYFRANAQLLEIAMPVVMLGGMVVFFARMLYQPELVLTLQDATLHTTRSGSISLRDASLKLAPWRMPNAGVPLGSVLQIEAGGSCFRIGGHGHAPADGLYSASAQFYVDCTMRSEEFERLLTSLGFSRERGFRTQAELGRQRFEFLPEALTGKLAFRSMWRWGLTAIVAAVLGNIVASAMPNRDGMMAGGILTTFVLVAGIVWIIVNALKIPAPTRAFEVTHEQLRVLDEKGQQLAVSPLVSVRCERLQYSMRTKVGTWVMPVLRISVPGLAPFAVYQHGGVTWNDGPKAESATPEFQLGSGQWNELVRALHA